MDPQFEGWAKLLKGGDPERSIDKPLAGFYRIKRKSKQDGRVTLQAVAYWYEGDKLMCVIDGQPVPELRGLEQWPWASRNPVSYEAYDAVVEKGQAWPDVHDLSADDFADEGDPAAGIGHNSGAVDPALTLERKIAVAEGGVSKYAVIESGKFKSLIASDEVRDKSQTLRSELLALSREAESHRETLNRPHLDAIRVNNEKWMPLVKSSKTAADFINKAQSAYETQKLLAAEAERHRLEAEAEAANEALEAQAHAAQAAVDRGEPPPQPVYTPPPPEPPRLAPTTSFKGGTGRAASVKPQTVITEVTDWRALFLYFVENEDARDEIFKRARKVLKDTGEIPPGCSTGLEAKVA